MPRRPAMPERSGEAMRDSDSGRTAGQDDAAAKRAPRRRGEAALRSLARGHVEAAIAALAAVMNDASASPAARVSAAGALLSWGYGKSALAASSGKERPAPERVVRLTWGDGTST